MRSPDNETAESDSSPQERENDIFEAFENNNAVENCDASDPLRNDKYETYSDDADILVWESDIPSIDD